MQTNIYLAPPQKKELYQVLTSWNFLFSNKYYLQISLFFSIALSTENMQSLDIMNKKSIYYQCSLFGNSIPLKGGLGFDDANCQSQQTKVSKRKWKIWDRTIAKISKSENIDNNGELVLNAMPVSGELWRLLKRKCCCISLQEPQFGAGLTNWMAMCQMLAIRILKN